MQTKKLTEASLSVTIFVILALIAFYIPAMAIIMILVLATPHAVLTWRQGLKAGLMAVVVSGMILALFLDIITAFILITLFAMVGTAIGYSAKRMTPGKVLLVGTLVGAVSFSVLLIVVMQITGIDMFGDMIKVYQEAILAVNEASNLVNLDTEALINQISLLTGYLMPAMIILFGFMTSYVNFMFFGLVGRRIGLKVPKTPLIYDISLPKWFGAVFLVGTALMIFSTSETVPYYIGMNISLLFTYPIIFQGLALAFVFMRQYIKSIIALISACLKSTPHRYSVVVPSF